MNNLLINNLTGQWILYSEDTVKKRQRRIAPDSSIYHFIKKSFIPEELYKKAFIHDWQHGLC